MPGVPGLRDIAREVADEPHASLQRLLALACELLAMDLAFVSVLDESGNRTVRLSVRADGTLGPTGFTEPLDATWCGRVVENDGLLVDDARSVADKQAMPSTAAFGIMSYAGVPLRLDDGSVCGTLCALGRAPHESLNPRDLDVLEGLAEVVSPLLQALDRPDAAPRSRPPGLAAVATAVEDVHDVEKLSRSLLAAIRDLTGMASAYLTVVHEDDGVQEIRYVENTREGLDLPEGLLLPWDDTLCKRALSDGRACETDVPAVWGDSRVARAWNIKVYISVPVETADGQLWGTLCAADPVGVEGVEAHVPTMRLFARLIAAEVQREAVAERARREREADPLTGCATRGVVQPWLLTRLTELSPEEVVVAAYISVDDLDEINGAHGRDAGDAVLVEVVDRLRAVMRRDDLVARMGEDEFLAAAVAPRSAIDVIEDRVRSALTFACPWRDGSLEVSACVGVAVSDGYDGPSLVTAAYAEMRGIRRAR